MRGQNQTYHIVLPCTVPGDDVDRGRYTQGEGEAAEESWEDGDIAPVG